MALSREKAAEFGLAFAIEGETRPSNPSVKLFEANLTLAGHTYRLQGKSEGEVLAQAERILAANGRLKVGEDDD